jgi:hypothetical protein
VKNFFSNAIETLAELGPADDEKIDADMSRGFAIAGQVEAGLLSALRRAKLAGWENRAKPAGQAPMPPREGD